MSFRLIAWILGLTLVASVPVAAPVEAASRDAAAPEPLVLADPGRPPLRIYLPRQASGPERTAARELANHLEQATGMRFRVRRERRTRPGDPAIYVGNTRAAREHGIRFESFEAEEWAIRTVPEGLILGGGRPRGSLYAVFRFLEDHVGVRWWSRYVTHVPRHETLELAPIDARGRPAFSYRDIHGELGAPLFFARNRINGHYGEAPEAYGGAERYGPPFMVHTFARYLPPDEHFAEHPEYYSEIEGVRVAEGQLCLTNEGLYQAMETRLREFIELGESKARRARRQPPTLYHVGPNDWGRACRCPACRREVGRRGESGLLLGFVNRLAEAIEKDYPHVRIDTLAYYYTLAPPRIDKPGDEVIIRLSGLQWRDFSRSILDEENREYREFFDGWAAITPRLRVWDYGVTFGPPGDVPLWNLGALARDYRFFHDQGVEGVFVQHTQAVTSDMRDLKLWVLTKLLEDPQRDVHALVDEFLAGFYGPAAPEIGDYLAELQRRSEAADCPIRPYGTAPQYCYLDLDLVSKAHAWFDRAEQAVAEQPALRHRVQHARMSLDRATLQIWSGLRQEQMLRREEAPALPELASVARRLRATWLRESRRHPAPRYEAARETMELELARWLDRAARAEARLESRQLSRVRSEADARMLAR